MASDKQKIDFINQIGPIIREVALKRGYSYPSAIIAQACLESGYNTSKLSKNYHNYFGLKCGSSWKGASVNMSTKEEYKVGVLTSIKDNFRCYADMKSGVEGYFDFISTKRYQSLKLATSPKDYLERIKSCGYATSSTYVSSNMNVIYSMNLERFDGALPLTNNEFQPSLSNKINQTPCETTTNAPSFLYTGKVTASVLNVRSGPGLNYNIIKKLSRHSKCKIEAEKNGWGRLVENKGWVFLDYIEKE